MIGTITEGSNGLASGNTFEEATIHAINELIVYDKHSSMKEKFDLMRSLRRKKFDAVVDLRNTVFPVFLIYNFSRLSGVSED